MSAQEGRLAPVHIVVGAASEGVVLRPESGESETVGRADFARRVRVLDAENVRWVWDDTTTWYPGLLEAGVPIGRCVDLRLSHAILRNSALTAGSELARAAVGPWDRPRREHREPDGALFALDDEDGGKVDADPVAEWALQQDAIATSADAGRIQRLLAAESAGALIAAEMRFAGMPWRADVHEELLAELLGPRPRTGERPAKIEALLTTTR